MLLATNLTIVKTEILNMTNLRHFTAHFSHDGDDVKSPRIVKLSTADVVVDGHAQILLLLVVDRLQRVGNVTVAPCLHLYKHYPFSLLCYDVDVAVYGMPVAFKNDKPLFLFSRENMCGGHRDNI